MMRSRLLKSIKIKKLPKLVSSVKQSVQSTCKPSYSVGSTGAGQVTTDRQIDRLVYELYDLTPSSGRQGGGDPPDRRNGRQVGIVEAGTKR